MFSRKFVMHKTAIIAMLATLTAALPAAAQKTGTSFTINAPSAGTVTVTPPVLTLNLSNYKLSATGPVAAGTVVGSITITTNPPGSAFKGHVSVSGTDGSKFSVTNSGSLPCSLIVGSNGLAGGTYKIALVAQ
jgi:hypothetical protein